MPNRLPFLLILLAATLPRPAAAATWPADAATCRTITDAVLHGRINAATDALTPAGASDALHRNLRALMQRLSDGAAAATHHLPPRLERVLPDRDVDGLPASVGLWSFGDREAYLVGCAIRPMGEAARISIQASPSWDELRDRLREQLAASADGE